MSVKIVRGYRNAFERQIMREGVQLLNSKNEYNRCSIPRLTIAPSRDEIMEEILEEQEEKKIKREILKLKQKLRSTGEEPKSKKRRLIDVCDQIMRENYMTWYIRRKEEERRKREEEIKDKEREERLEKARKKKAELLEKIKSKGEISRGLRGRDREWIQRKKENWRKYREQVNMDEIEENDVYRVLLENVRVREPKVERESVIENIKLREPRIRYGVLVEDGNSAKTDLDTKPYGIEVEADNQTLEHTDTTERTLVS